MFFNSSFIAKKNTSPCLCISSPILGFGYKKEYAQNSIITIGKVTGEKLLFSNMILIEYKNTLNQEGLFRIDFKEEQREEYINIFNKIISSFKVF